MESTAIGDGLGLRCWRLRKTIPSISSMSYGKMNSTLPEKPAARPDHPTLSSGLLAGARQMDSASWSRLVTTFGPIVYGWCRNSGVPETDAADVVQEVFVSVTRNIGGFERQKESGSFRSWLATITRSRVKDYFRRRAKRDVAAGGTAAWQRLELEPDVFDSEISSSICPDTATGTLHRRVLESVRAEFESNTWTAFWLTTVDGKSAADVAADVGVSVASVYQSKSRVLRRLRQRLTELPE